jgi:hypothetical protein
MKIRYIRDWANGSSMDERSFWAEMGAYKDGVNVALGKPCTADDPQYTPDEMIPVTDGDIESWVYFPTGGLHYIQVDLGEVLDIEEVKIIHYIGDPRTFYETKTEVSTNGTDWITVFDSAIEGTYLETTEGNIISLPSGSSTLKKGNLDIINAKLGNAQIDKIYKGTELIWEYVTSPVTTGTTINPSSTIQNSIPITVSLSTDLTDATIYYRIGTGTQQTYTAPFTVNQDNPYVQSALIPITYWSVHSGGTEAEKTITYDTKGAIPSLVTEVTVTNGINQVTLDWQPTTNTTSYSVFRSTTQGVIGTVIPESQWLTVTNFVDPTAIGGTTYYYTVRSSNFWRVTDSSQVVANPTASTESEIVTRTLKPTALWSTNMTPNNVTYLQDNPASVDANNLVPTSTTVAPYAEVYFGKLTDGVLEGTQKIRLSYVDDINWVGLYIDVLENGVVKQSFASSPTYNGYGDLVAEFSFDASIITDKTGINVAIMVRGILFNGLTIASLRAVEWLATVRTGSQTPQEPPQGTNNWRYVKYMGYGDNTGTGTTRLIELKANGGGTNYMLGKLPMAGYTPVSTGGNISTVTDNNIAMSGFPIWWVGEGKPILVYDLGASRALDNLQVWMYSMEWENRQTKFWLQVSNDNVNWTDVADYRLNTTPQSPTDGWTFPAPPN